MREGLHLALLRFMLELLLQCVLAEPVIAKTCDESAQVVKKENKSATEKSEEPLNKKTNTEEEKLSSILDLDPKAVLGSYVDQSTKKTVNVTRGDVISYLKAIGFDVSSAQPVSQIKEIEMQAAAFLVVMNYILPLAKEAGIEKELAERIKFMGSQLIYARFMEKRVMDKINVETIRQEAIAEVKKKRAGEYCYDTFVVVTKSADKAKEVINKINAVKAKESDALTKEIENIAEEAHKEIDEKTLKHPTLIAAKRTNGWLLPREMMMQEASLSEGGKTSDLVYLFKEIILQFLGKEIGEKIVGKDGKGGLKASKLFGEPFKFEDHYLVVYVVSAKPFDKLGKLVEMFAAEDMRNIMRTKQKEMQHAVIKEIYNKHKADMKLSINDDKIFEKVLKMFANM